MATIKDIADKVGVSPAAVSRVLSNDTTLSLSLRKRRAILETAAALNYVSPSARRRDEEPAQKRNRKQRIGLLEGLSPEEELANPFFLMLRLAAERRLRELGLESVRLFRNNLQDDPSPFSRLSGLITLGIYSPSEVAALHAHGVNIVVTDLGAGRGDGYEHVDCVGSDLDKAVTDLMNALCRSGYRRMGFIGWPLSHDDRVDTFGDERCRAYIAWMRGADLYDPDLCAVAELTVNSGYELTHALLDKSRPDVLIAANDSMALGAYKALAERGFSIPDDIAVVGFNDIQAAQFLAPTLSTVKVFAEHIGAAAADLVRERIEGRDYAKRVVIPTQMIWRESCLPAPIDDNSPAGRRS